MILKPYNARWARDGRLNCTTFRLLSLAFAALLCLPWIRRCWSLARYGARLFLGLTLIFDVLLVPGRVVVVCDLVSLPVVLAVGKFQKFMAHLGFEETFGVGIDPLPFFRCPALMMELKPDRTSKLSYCQDLFLCASPAVQGFDIPCHFVFPRRPRLVVTLTVITVKTSFRFPAFLCLEKRALRPVFDLGTIFTSEVRRRHLVCNRHSCTCVGPRQVLYGPQQLLVLLSCDTGEK